MQFLLAAHISSLDSHRTRLANKSRVIDGCITEDPTGSFEYKINTCEFEGKSNDLCLIRSRTERQIQTKETKMMTQ